MKKLMLFFLLGAASLAPCNAQTQEVTQLILNLEKLRELRKILKELKKGYDILFEGYTKIRDLSRGNFKLHEAFLDGLLQVSPGVKSYGRIADIVKMQLEILNECRTARAGLAASGSFTTKELDYLAQVYSDLIAGSIKNLDALTNVITAKKLRASDDERLAMIDQIHSEMSEKLVFLRHVNSNNSLLAAQRKDERASIETTETIYDIKP
ncbi:hypothetical protein SAMN04487996_111267 [Dyadobacter soli]|uniref:TerB family tellurite resistance protein n=1 Tax=Dyadobacter soli TaxID=659014 RepID=A0A1G7MH56_9BACT|nr:hypothetical protein [Dyadobacter soli]SDF61055.1 hypothetical protein SAMN04487996_111267 [Dyadobacter soli]